MDRLNGLGLNEVRLYQTLQVESIERDKERIPQSLSKFLNLQRFTEKTFQVSDNDDLCHLLCFQEVMTYNHIPHAQIRRYDLLLLINID